MKKVLLLLLFISTLSCKKTEVAREIIKDFSENRWQATDIKKFEFSVDKDIAEADIKLLFSHIHEPQYEMVSVSIMLENPKGERESIYNNFRITGENGKNLSVCAGDICDFYTIIKENIKLEKGVYKITVENKCAGSYLPNVLALGVVVESKN